MKKTAAKYFLWRFAGADDRESLENRSKKVNFDDEKLRKQPWCFNLKSVDVRKCDMSDTSDGKKVRAAVVTWEVILNRQKHGLTKSTYKRSSGCTNRWSRTLGLSEPSVSTSSLMQPTSQHVH